MAKTSIKERNKAVRKAWEREQRLVQKGQGTRDWTEEQQKDILNPDKGKAYDEQGRAFEGQHMKSAAEYPKYQGNPDNIQFLTKDEHLKAHKGSWQNPTNWQYNPVTNEFINFAEDELIPCSTIELSNPIVSVAPKSGSVVKKNENLSIAKSKRKRVPLSKKKTIEKSFVPKNNKNEIIRKIGSEFGRKIKKFKRITYDNLPEIGKDVVDGGISLVIDAAINHVISAVIGKGQKWINSFSSNRNSSNSSNSISHTIMSNLELHDKTKAADIVEQASRVELYDCSEKQSYTPNDVPAGSQRYHTNDGIVWIDKPPFHRGGKDS